MSFLIMGNPRRHRIHPRKVRRPSGYKGGTSIHNKVEVERTHTVKPAAQKKGFKSRMVTNLRSLFGRGNR